MMCKALNQYRVEKDKRWWKWSLNFNEKSNYEEQKKKNSINDNNVNNNNNNEAEEYFNVNNNVFENKIVLANRGNCLFEEKSVVSSNEGAVALIVQNTEVFYYGLLFLLWLITISYHYIFQIN
jgi:hypothetical protein